MFASAPRASRKSSSTSAGRRGYPARVGDDELIDLEGLEVPRRLLDSAGGDLPTSWEGLPLRVDTGPEVGAEEPPVPRTGWRPLAGPTESERDPRWGTVIAAPTGDGTGRWLLMHLSRTDVGWRGWIPWATTPRPARPARRRGLRLSWPSPTLDVTASELLDLKVTLRRDDGAPLAWDGQDHLDVVAWVRHATTGEPLAFNPWRASGGTGAQLDADVTSVDLPVTWLTDDVARLATGAYEATATLISLDLATEPCRLSLRPA